jgi:hypothetical protein
MLEVLAAAEPLPVRVLDPALHHCLIREVEGVLEIGQPDHEPSGFGGSPERAVEATERLIEAIPVDESSEAEQLVTAMCCLRQCW